MVASPMSAARAICFMVVPSNPCWVIRSTAVRISRRWLWACWALVVRMGECGRLEGAVPAGIGAQGRVGPDATGQVGQAKQDDHGVAQPGEGKGRERHEDDKACVDGRDEEDRKSTRLN